MPNVLAAFPPQERKEKLEALVHFLASTGSFVDTHPVPKSITKGKKLFHEIGCAACHGPYEANLKNEATVIPLGNLSKKYSIVSLTLFLQDPHKTRPSGRMPGLHLTFAEAQDISHYLLSSLKVAEETFILNAGLVKKGRELFAALGCASCHNLKDGKVNIVSTLKATDLAKLKPGAGCLTDQKTGAPPSPRYALNASQRTALTAALKTLAQAAKPSAQEAIAQTMTTFNCYACHQRGGKGGVENGLNDFFTTTQKEMGDEGRLPPHLNGVGGKLNSAYLKKVLAGGVIDRPYMFTRMPKFGEANVGQLQTALEAADPVPASPMPIFQVSDKTIKTQGRQMVGDTFGCVKCHNFREFKSGGIQGMNMTIMTERLRREWFTLYLLDPYKYRPGTRMPAVWPLGQSQLPKVLEGDTAQQIEAVWRYLADGANAALPTGVGKQKLPLIALESPIIYRNFIEGAEPEQSASAIPKKSTSPLTPTNCATPCFGTWNSSTPRATGQVEARAFNRRWEKASCALPPVPLSPSSKTTKKPGPRRPPRKKATSSKAIASTTNSGPRSNTTWATLTWTISCSRSKARKAPTSCAP